MSAPVKVRPPLALDVVTATAEQYGVCVRPFTMEVGDLSTGALRYVGVPCASTVESVWAVCAEGAGVADDAVPRGLAPHQRARGRSP